MKIFGLFISISLLTVSSLLAQPEVYPWGNISGSRVTIFVTNDMSSMSKGRRAWVRNGTATFYAESNSFITLLVDGESPF